MPEFEHRIAKFGIRWHTNFKHGSKALIHHIKSDDVNVICCAYTVRYQGKICMKFIKLGDFDELHQLVSSINLHERTFFNILTSAERAMYIDIDFKCTEHDVDILHRSNEIGKSICEELIAAIFDLNWMNHESVDNFRRNTWLFDMSRELKSQHQIKISFHILLPMIVCSHPSIMARKIKLIQDRILFNRQKLNHYAACIDWISSIDMSVYEGVHYQLLRQPRSIKIGEPSSFKRLIAIHPCQINTSFLKQLLLNQCQSDSRPSFNRIPTPIHKNMNSFIYRTGQTTQCMNNVDKYIQCKVLKYSNDVECTNQMCCSSITSATTCDYHSITNGINWIETRCQSCHHLITCASQHEFNPRHYANLNGTLKQIESLNIEIVRLKVKCPDNKYMFKPHQTFEHKIYGNCTQIMLKFSLFTRLPCDHTPSFIRTDPKFVGKMQLWCPGCHCFYR